MSTIFEDRPSGILYLSGPHPTIDSAYALGYVMGRADATAGLTNAVLDLEAKWPWRPLDDYTEGYNDGHGDFS